VRIVVVGAGVSGLSCGVRLLEAGGSHVTIVSREAPGETTSAVAGAIWFPYRARPNERTGPWGALGYERFERLSREDGLPITMVEVTSLYGEPLAEDPWWLASVPANAVRAPAASELPDGYADGRTVRVPCIEAPPYLDWLCRRFAELGGRFERSDLSELREAEGDVVVNCAGVGAHRLTGDAALRPVRGQVAYVRTRDPVRFMVDEEGPNALAYVLPRPDVTVLGGTAEEDDWEPSPRAETTRSILERTRLLEPRLEGATYLGSAVGLRPGRTEVRLERDSLPDGRPLIHNYGHGGSGFTLSWGCADEVARLALGSAA
jgi:D-amino-acid oxidase